MLLSMKHVVENGFSASHSHAVYVVVKMSEFYHEPVLTGLRNQVKGVKTPCRSFIQLGTTP
jgi:hypothetical protein